MNFFKRFYRRKTLSILDDTQNKKKDLVKARPGSGGLRRSGGLSRDDYNTSETKLFEEPLVPFSEESNQPNNHSEINTVAHAVNGTTSYGNQNYIFHQEGSVSSPASDVEKPASHHTRLPSTLPDEEKAQEMMSLYASIIRGEKSAVKKLLIDNPDLLEAPDNFGRTPLMYCVLSDRLDCAKSLLKMKSALHQVDKAGRSALHLAAHKGSYKFVQLLHDRGGNIELQDNDGQTPLHLITRNRDTSCMEFLLRHLSSGMAEVTDNQNRTALHWSAAFNNKDSVKLLIKYNCNTAVADIEGKTPLHWAANTHDQSVDATLNILLESSPSTLNWQDYEGRTALHFAVAHENVAAVQALLNFEQEKCELDRLDNTFRTPLHWAAQLGNSNIVELLLSAGANNSISDENGATPLLYAALHNKSDVVSEIIRHDPNILEQADIEGRTALMWAAGKGANGVIQLLLGLNGSGDESPDKPASATSTHQATNNRNSLMVDINRVDNKGNTALHMAAWNGHSRSAELLLSCNAKHDLQNNMNHTPLFGACEKGHLSVVESLLDYNASIQLRDLVERTPLHWAAIGGHGDVCDFLIQKGVHPDVRDTFQRSPLHCAAFGGHINCMNLLLENKANVDLQDQEGMSALHWAAQAGHLDATKLLFQCSAFLNSMEFTEERLTPLDHALLNERDEVAQYLMEQGALSSETIRDIAATRIQACYRGYQVRKAFLNRKNLLIQHEMLRNRNRGKKRTITASSDHLNSVGEEMPLKSPVAAFDPIPVSSADELATDVSSQPNADVMTVKSPAEIAVTENEDLKYLAMQDFFREDSIAPPVDGEKREDESPDLVHSSSFALARSLESDDDRSSEENQQDEDKSNMSEDQMQEAKNCSTSVGSLDFASTGDKVLSEETSDVSKTTQPRTDAAVIASADTTMSEGGNQPEKRRKKKKHRQLPNLPDSTSSDRMSAPIKKARKTKLKSRDDTAKAGNNPKHSDYPFPSSATFTAAGTSSATTEPKAQPSVRNAPKTVLSTESSALLSFCENDETSPTNLSSSVNDLHNIGTDDQINIERVSGLAYSSTVASRDLSEACDLPQYDSMMGSSLLEATASNSHLSLSEYIESLMSLSLSERKMLSTIQRNRKMAFQQANMAASVIQRSWRRYLEKKAPARKCLDVRSNNENDEKKITDDDDEKKRKKTARKKKGMKKEKEERKREVSVAPRLPSTERVDSVKKSSKQNIAETLNPIRVESPNLLTFSKSFEMSAPEAVAENKKSQKKKKKRPQTCTAVSSSLSAVEQDSHDERKSTLPGLIVSDVDSEYLIRTRKVRPKTTHARPRRRRSEKKPNEDNFNQKIKELNKVYGQTLPLLGDRKSSVLKSSLRASALPVVRPRTSRTYSSEFERFQFVSPHLDDPVTAVQSYPMDGWDNLWEKKHSNSVAPVPTPPVRKKSLRRKKPPQTRYTFQSWKNTYGGPSTSSSVSRKSASTVATRFSYNMKASKS